MRPKKVVLCVSSAEDRLCRQVFLLELRGYRVLVAESGEQALTILRGAQAGAVDVLVSEFELLDMNGNELARRAKQIHTDIPVLVLSYQICGYDHETSADAFLPKGCNEPMVLLERIRVLAARKRGPKKLLPGVWFSEEKASVA